MFCTRRPCCIFLNMAGRGKKLQRLHYYYIFSDSRDMYLTRNHNENYSPKMVPTNPTGSWTISFYSKSYIVHWHFKSRKNISHTFSLYGSVRGCKYPYWQRISCSIMNTLIKREPFTLYSYGQPCGLARLSPIKLANAGLILGNREVISNNIKLHSLQTKNFWTHQHLKIFFNWSIVLMGKIFYGI